MQMKKEILKGFSLLAMIIVLALMTAVASVNANAPSSDDLRSAAVSR
jgi:type II secretory pathway pseudopilin PulG